MGKNKNNRHWPDARKLIGHLSRRPAANPQHQQLIDLYEEFVKTDDGEFLELGLQRFVEFVQSRQE